MVDFRLRDENVDGETHILEPHGEVDLYTAPALKTRILEVIAEGKSRLVVDLSKATFIDSTALGVLAHAHNRLRGPEDALALVCVDEQMLRIFDVSGFDRVIPIHKTREEALAAVGEPVPR